MKKNSYTAAKIADKVATGVLYSVAVFFLLLLAALTVYILFKGAKALSPELLAFSGEGVGVQLFNTMYLVLISLIITIPIGVLAGVYMAEYAKEGLLTNAIRISIETLSSLPSIVVGLFGYLALIIMTGSKVNILAGAVAVSILNIPSLTRVTEDAVREIPNAYREGSYGIGATKWQTIVKVLLPSAFPRILTGIILAAGRGFGEAAALLYTAGMGSDVDFSDWNPFSPLSPLNPFRSADTLAVRIWVLKTEGLVQNGDKIADIAAAILIFLVFAFSLGSRAIGKAMQRKIGGDIK